MYAVCASRATAALLVVIAVGTELSPTICEIDLRRLQQTIVPDPA